MHLPWLGDIGALGAYTPHLMLICCGQAFIDRVFFVSEDRLKSLGIIPGERRLVSAEESIALLKQLEVVAWKDIGGGSSANSMAIFAGLGGAARFLTSVGADSYGVSFRDDLSSLGMDVRSVTLAEHPTGVCLAAVSERGTRTMFMSLGAAAHLDFSSTDFDGAGKADWLLTEAYSFFSSAPRLVERLVAEAHRREVSVAFSLSDPRVVTAKRSEILALIDQVDLLIGNEAEYAALALPAEVLPRTRRVISHGEKGVSLIQANKNVREANSLPAHVVDVVDTTGAGDALAGALLYGETAGLDPIESAERAVRVAAEVVKTTGARLTRERVRAAWGMR